jgi:hypothetical protein
MSLSPIILFVYNRPKHTKILLDSLRRNELVKDSHLIVYSDGPRNEGDLDKIREVRDLIEEIDFCKSVKLVKSQRNNGLAKSIMYGVSEVLEQYGNAIILEDDLQLSSGFLKYMNQALDLYKDDKKVMHISGYLQPIDLNKNATYFFNLANCWGWATWSDRWEKMISDPLELKKRLFELGKYQYFNLDGGSDLANQLDCNIWGIKETWAVRWHGSIVLEDGFCLHPGMSLVRNTGFDGSGENTGIEKVYSNQKIIKEISVKRIEIKESEEIRGKVKDLFLGGKTWWKKYMYLNYAKSSLISTLFRFYIKSRK